MIGCPVLRSACHVTMQDQVSTDGKIGSLSGALEGGRPTALYYVPSCSGQEGPWKLAAICLGFDEARPRRRIKNNMAPVDLFIGPTILGLEVASRLEANTCRLSRGIKWATIAAFIGWGYLQWMHFCLARQHRPRHWSPQQRVVRNLTLITRNLMFYWLAWMPD